jgi:hypothetical protein
VRLPTNPRSSGTRLPALKRFGGTQRIAQSKISRCAYCTVPLEKRPDFVNIGKRAGHDRSAARRGHHNDGNSKKPRRDRRLVRGATATIGRQAHQIPQSTIRRLRRRLLQRAEYFPVAFALETSGEPGTQLGLRIRIATCALFDKRSIFIAGSRGTIAPRIG